MPSCSKTWARCWRRIRFQWSVLLFGRTSCHSEQCLVTRTYVLSSLCLVIRLMSCHSEERSDEESAVCMVPAKSRSLAPLGMTILIADELTDDELMDAELAYAGRSKTLAPTR